MMLNFSILITLFRTIFALKRISSRFEKVKRSKEKSDRDRRIFRGIFCLRRIQEEYVNLDKAAKKLTSVSFSGILSTVDLFESPLRVSKRRMPEKRRFWGLAIFFLFLLGFRFPRIILGYQGTIRKVFNSRPVERNTIERNTIS